MWGMLLNDVVVGMTSILFMTTMTKFKGLYLTVSVLGVIAIGRKLMGLVRPLLGHVDIRFLRRWAHILDGVSSFTMSAFVIDHDPKWLVIAAVNNVIVTALYVSLWDGIVEQIGKVMHVRTFMAWGQSGQSLGAMFGGCILWVFVNHGVTPEAMLVCACVVNAFTIPTSFIVLNKWMPEKGQ